MDGLGHFGQGVWIHAPWPKWQPRVVALLFQNKFASACRVGGGSQRWSVQRYSVLQPTLIQTNRTGRAVGPGHLQQRNRIDRVRLANSINEEAGASRGRTDQLPFHDLQTARIARVGAVSLIKVTVDGRDRNSRR